MKKGVSPIVATVLLIAITVVLAAIIFLWARSFLAEGAQKNGRAVELACEGIVFQAGLSRANNQITLDVVNQGDLPIYGFIFKKEEIGGLQPFELSEAKYNVPVGESLSLLLVGVDGDISGEIEQDVSSALKGIVIPILLAEQESGGRITHACPDESGIEVEIAAS